LSELWANTMSTQSVTKQAFLAELNRRKDELVKLCCDLVRIPSENPPGDTTEVAEFLTTYVEGKGIKVNRYEPKKGLPILLATIEGLRQRPNLVLNAHMDEFVAEVGKPWVYCPFAGEVRNGRILGRGASDMKGGLSASLFAFTLVKELGIRLQGQLTLTLVSDEETGGKWGAEWLLDNVQEACGDACLSGEPTGTDQVVIGEKGANWFSLTASGKSTHAAYSMAANTIEMVAKALVVAQGLQELRGAVPSDIMHIVEESKKAAEAKFGKGAGRNVDHIVVSAGTIRGGVKVNMVPAYCEAQLDTRAPWGISSNQIGSELKRMLGEAGLEEVKCEFIIRNEPTYTSPNDRLVQVVAENVKTQTGSEPRITLAPWFTDTRFFRRKEIPSVVLGPKDYGMAAENEYITVEDLLTVARVHAGTIVDYFAA